MITIGCRMSCAGYRATTSEHRAAPPPAALMVVLCLLGLLAGCGGGGGSGSSAAIEYETIAGKVIDGAIQGALVCLDTNANGQCDGGEPQARSGTGGAYQ